MADVETNAEAGAFHLNPAASITGVLDFSDKEAKKLYTSAIKPLFSQEEKYECNPDEMNGFLKAVHNRANEYGWDDEDTGILHIPIDHQDPMSDTSYLRSKAIWNHFHGQDSRL